MSKLLSGESWSVFFDEAKRFITLDDIDWETPRLDFLYYRFGEFEMHFKNTKKCYLFFDEKDLAAKARKVIKEQYKKSKLPEHKTSIRKIQLHMKNYHIFLPEEEFRKTFLCGSQQ